MSRIAHLLRRHGLDALIVLLTAEAVIEVSVRRGASDAPRTTLWFDVPAIALMVLPLFARRRFPFAAPAAFWFVALAISFVDARLITFLTSVFVIGMIASFLLGNLRDAVHARLGLGITVGSAAVIVWNKPGYTTSELLFIPLLFGICWLAGFAMRERLEQVEAAERRAALAEREQDAAARVAVAEERARIARELHDIVAHAVSVMVLQAGAVRHKLPDGMDEDRDALQRVEQTGRTALAEMRRLLGAMRNGDDAVELGPQPGLDRLAALIDDVGRAGLPVQLHVEGEPVPLPRAIDLSAYRIVQEALTNTIKHAAASRADVTVRYGAEALDLEVRDDGTGPGSPTAPGHGLIGVRERVRIYGGEMTAGAAPGGYVLTARLPLEGYRL